MKLNDLYNANIFINDALLEISPTDYSFSIKDNINNLYATATMNLLDGTGLLQEYLQTAIGSKFKIGFGDDKVLNTATYRNLYDYFDEIDNPGQLNGRVDLFFIHDYFFQQEIKSKAYSNRISKVVRDLVHNYDFTTSEGNIDDTGNESVWYQCMVTDAKFIKEYLLPFAYSNNASHTPFYAYITSDNVFNFRNLRSILDEGTIATVEYRPVSDYGKDVDVSNTTTNLKRWRTSYKNIWSVQNRKAYKISLDDGTLVEEEDKIGMYPSQNNLSLPIINENKGSLTGYHMSYNFMPYDETGDQENETGYLVSQHREEQFIDNFMLLQPMNPKFHAGKTIQLNIYMPTKNGIQLSKNWSGKYIIRECEHIWDGKNLRAYSKLLVGRKYIQIPSSYLLKGKLL